MKMKGIERERVGERVRGREGERVREGELEVEREREGRGEREKEGGRKRERDQEYARIKGKGREVCTIPKRGIMTGSRGVHMNR